jgi:hypothetical protein
VRCECPICALEAALVLLRTGRVSMGALLVEQALERAREAAEQREGGRRRAAPPKGRARKAKPKARASA